MKLFKSVTLSLALVTMIVSFSLSANAATPQSGTKSPSFSQQKLASPAKLAELEKNSIPVIPSVSTNAEITPFSALNTNVYYSFSALAPEHYIDSINNLTVTTAGTVKLTLVQHTDGGTGSVKLYYQLKGTSGTTYNSTSLVLNGSYTSSNITIAWSSIPTGTYKVEITNAPTPDSSDAAGNGYTS